MGQPFQRGADVTLLQYLVGAALYTWREAFIGFVLGSLLGLGLATVFVHCGSPSARSCPYVIASQTIPIIALAPLIVFALGQGVLLGRRHRDLPHVLPGDDRDAPRPALVRPARARAACARTARRGAGIYTKLRLPASMPYLFTALKIAATASIVGAIIAEDTGAHPGGARSRDHHVQPVLRHGSREAVGGDLRRGDAGRRCSSSSSGSRRCSSCAAGRGWTRDRHRAQEPRTGVDRGRHSARRPDQRRRQGVRDARRRPDGRPPGDRPRHRARASSCRSSARRAVASRRCCASSATSSSRPGATVLVNGKTAERARRDRDYGMVFQAPVLFDWRSVEDNVKLPLEILGKPKDWRAKRAQGDARPRRARATSRATCRTSSRAACSSGSRSPGRCRSSPGSCSWTSRSGRSTR